MIFSERFRSFENFQRHGLVMRMYNVLLAYLSAHNDKSTKSAGKIKMKLIYRYYCTLLAYVVG